MALSEYQSKVVKSVDSDKEVEFAVQEVKIAEAE
jgi:hypothetical protein